MNNIWGPGKDVTLIVHTNVEDANIAMYMNALRETVKKYPIITKGPNFGSDIQVLSVIAEFDPSTHLYKILLSGVVV